MFEGVVSQVLAGLLGRYVKGIQKEQLKIGIWNEEINLENVELILEAFDYLQLPFALKTGMIYDPTQTAWLDATNTIFAILARIGRIGKLSIKIPWKKLGWDPIIIVIEDVFWGSDSLGKRELAGKLAKLNAIELAKFSRRVTDNQTGQSLLSYMSAKILDNIQVSIRNVHIIYVESHNDQGSFIFGLEFSSLSIQTDTQKQSFAMSLMARSRQDEVNKKINISNVGIYCQQLEEQQNLYDVGALTDAQSNFSLGLAHPRDDYLINPFCVTVSVLANNSGKRDGVPQYDMTAELTALVLSIDEIQLQQVLNLCDHFTICALRTKYGRYRPPESFLSKRQKGWQIMWWQYAKDSIMADVERRLKKTSWRFLGKRLEDRRKYVNLYRMKLELLQKGQLVSKDILQKLETLDKECDIDDIVSYRTIAEQQLQDLSVKSTKDNFSSPGSPRTDEPSAGAGRGWLNWLSLGMLGAGGTADTSSFAGVVSEDIIKDIYEGTEFHPVSSAENHLTKENHYSLRLSIPQILATVTSRQVSLPCFISLLIDGMFTGLGTEYKIWDDSATILAWLDSLEITNPLNKNKVLLAEKVIVQEFNAIYEPELFFNLLHIYDLFSSFQFQHDRVLSSLNCFDNFGTRLLSKLEYMSVNQKKLLWDLRIHHFVIKLPSYDCGRELTMVVSIIPYQRVFEAEDVSMRSKDTVDNDSQTQDNNYFLDYMSKKTSTCFSDSLIPGLQLDDLYKHFEVKVLMASRHDITSTLVKLDASIVLGLCIFLDEPMLKQLEVASIVRSANIYFSQTMYSAVVNLCTYLKESNLVGNTSIDTKTSGPNKPALNMSASLKLDKLSLRVDLEDNGKEASLITVGVGDIDIRYAVWELSELWVITKMVEITCTDLKNKSNSHVLCSSGNYKTSTCVYLTGFPESSAAEACLKLHYKTHKYNDQIHHVYQLNLNDVDLHVHPSVFGQIKKFLSNLDAVSPGGSAVVSSSMDQSSMKPKAANAKFPKLSLSDICGAESASFGGVSVDHFPFLHADIISNFGCLETQDVQALDITSSKSKQCHETSGLNGYSAPELASNVQCKTEHSSCSSNSPNNGNNVSTTILDLSLVSVRTHFHESCGILATLTVPESIATFSLADATSWDLLFSAKDIMLASPWTSPSVSEVLWGTYSHCNSNVLNVRVKKDLSALSTEVCIATQNVCCVLPTKLLAMFIGYFLLDDWDPMVEEHHSVASNNLECSGELHDSITYKIEICDCVILFPVENQELFCIKLGVPYFFCEFIPTGISAEFVKRIPKEFFSLECTLSSRADVISLCSRNASISLVFLNEQTKFIPKLDEDMPARIHPLVEKLDAGIWIQVPCKELSCSEQPLLATFIMSKISKCNLIPEDLYFMDGMETVIHISDELTSIVKESKMYEGNARQFLECRRSNEESVESNEPINITISIKDLVVLFGHSKDKDLPLEKVATANLEFDVSAVMVSEKPEHVDMDIVSLALHSSGGHTLASIVSDGPSSPVLIKFTKHHAGRDEILITVPFFETWLYLVDWDIIINHFHSYIRKEGNSLHVGHPAALPHFSGSAMSSFLESESQDNSYLVVTCENIAVVVHVPIWEKEQNESSNYPRVDGNSGSYFIHHADDNQSIEPRGCKFVTLTFESKHFVVMLGESWVKFKCDLDRVKVILEMIQVSKGTSVPFMHISKIKAGGYIHQSETDMPHLSVDLQAEYMDVSFSHQIFSFWRSIELRFPKSSSSASSFCSVTFKVGLRKGSLLLNDGRWSSHGPVIETLVKNLSLQFSQMGVETEVSAFVDFLINYNNIDKVMWEPFIEPSSFQLNILRKCADHALDVSPSTEVSLNSSKQLNVNISEPLIEAIFRLSEMITDSLNPSSGGDLREDPGIVRLSRDDVHTRRYAPYILSNDTSLPFSFKVYRGAVNSDDIDSFSVVDENSVPAGYSVPIYVEETLDEFFFQHRETQSSEHLIEKWMSAVSHYMISIEFEGTSGSSKPMSIDLVGIYFFEVNFSSSKKPILGEESLEAFGSSRKGSHHDGLIVPVVLDVSLQNYSKLVRVYSTVILFNATSMPLELRFDIPFGVSSKLLTVEHSWLSDDSQGTNMRFLKKLYPAEYTVPSSSSAQKDNGGVAHQVSLKEVGTASIYFVDPSNDLGITFHIQDYRSVTIKFPRVEAFSNGATSNGLKFSLTETIAFYSNVSKCPFNVMLEKATDAHSGARELCLSVPFLLYNCTDLLLTVTEISYERSGSTLLIPCSFELDGHTRHVLGKNGLSLVSEDPSIQRFASKMPQLDFIDGHSSHSNRRVANNSEHVQKECDKEAKAYMFAPAGHTPATELSVKLNASVPNSGTETTRRDWSSPFLLVPASGSTSLTIPQSSTSSAFLIAVTSVPVSTELFGRTKAIAFQPRELLVSIRFDGPGWQWSGSFFPDRLGDAQVKMRNSASGVSNMVRVEVQNADIDIHSKKIAGRNNSTTGTILILLSDDKTGFVPYRIDNFSLEKLRIYQQRCESIETIVYPYTSCQYAWDEPCYPHRLVVEVPGERSLGTYSLDVLSDDVHVALPSTPEKAERKFGISVHAEGAIKVLSIIDSNCHNMDTKEAGVLGSREPKDADHKQEIGLNFTEVIKIHLPFMGISLISSSPQELLFASAKDMTFVAMQSLDQQRITVEIPSMQIDNQFSDSPYPVMLSFEGSHKGKSINFLKSKDTKQKSLSESKSSNTLEPVLRFAAVKWRTRDTSFLSYQRINISVAPFCLELEERLVLSMIDFVRSVSSRVHFGVLEKSVDSSILCGATDNFGEYAKISKNLSDKPQSSYTVDTDQDNGLLPSVIPIGAPWQQIHLLARKQKKVYIELFELTPVKLTFSFTSTPWLNRNEGVSDPSTSFNNSTAIQRGLMALIDVEGVPVHLGEIMVENLMASWQSIQDILVRHYSRQLLHELYKVFGSAGVIGNPMGFARNVGFGLKDFMSASRKGKLQSPVELLNGIAQGSKNLIGSTVYAVSSATSHFSKTAYKVLSELQFDHWKLRSPEVMGSHSSWKFVMQGLVAFTYDEQAASKLDERDRQLGLHGEGVLNGFLEGLTGLLQSPIRGAEKHGLPGVISGIAMGTAGLVARPMASILEATGRTAQSIRNRSNPHESNRLRVRFSRPVARDRPLFPYSWEEAVGVSLLVQADGGRLKDETFVVCKTLREPGKFLVLSEKLLLLVSSRYLVDLGSPRFVGVPPDPQWAIETEMNLKSIVHLDRAQEVVNIVGSNGETSPRDKRGRSRDIALSSAFIPLFHFSVELPNIEDAEGTLQFLMALIEKGKARRWDKNILHRSNIS
ncbi:Putative vacuolar protein sorting-associated protein 13A [Triticum urartu]|uniref:Putative vacuolar protein sorting-associated protein 13A n=1 Tax=Triticum urartu TaxID=4572 RepID=M7YJ01_TRIUA|nr:Putative vacuolar protein sorting-associated protein 13A [Triticum urartu]